MARAPPLLLLLLSVGAGDADGASAPIDIGNSTQLFVDDLLVASSESLTRTMHSPQPSFQTAITADAPWEADFAIGVIGTSVIAEAGRIRVYYALRNKTLGCGHGDQPACSEKVPPQPNYEPSAGPILTAVAESTTGGRTWTKPLLGKYPIHGSTANNVLGEIFAPDRRVNHTHVDTVFIDPKAPQSRRYRGVSGGLAFSSADGIDWVMESHAWNASCAALMDGDWGTCGTDTKPVVFHDQACDGGSGCYSFYTRFKNK